MKVGIVGLPNVGKSTLFTALTKKEVPRENYPFCTIEPNVGLVALNDPRLATLSRISHSKTTTPVAVEFFDIAGLVKGAHGGEGLGNEFLNHIREVDAIAHVVRGFEDQNIHHVHGAVNPFYDMEIINTELIMRDLQLIEKRIEAVEGRARSGDKELVITHAMLSRIKDELARGHMISTLSQTDDEQILLKDMPLLTKKPMLYVFNVHDAHGFVQNQRELLSKLGEQACLILNLQQEVELAELGDEELQAYLKELNLVESGLNKFVRASFGLLNLMTFFTSGEKETRGWTITRGMRAPEAAGKIHSDIERGFIRAEVVSYDDFVMGGGWVGAKEKGVVRIEGKEYLMREGDVCYFRFSV